MWLLCEARGGTVGWGTALQAGRLWVQSLMSHWNFSFTYSFQLHYDPGVDSASHTNGAKKRKLYGTVMSRKKEKKKRSPFAYLVFYPITVQHPVPSVNITHMFVVLCMITCIIPLPCSSQKLQFVGERCIFVTICTSFLSLQTIAVKSSLAQTQHCLVSLNCRKAVKSGGIPFLLGHDPTTTDFSLCWAAR